MNTLSGYHGTTQENANKILEQQYFKESTKENEWLGKGVYFFAFKDSAKWWIQADRYKNQDTAILKAVLKYENEQFLELDDPAQLKKINEYMKYIASQNKVVRDLYLEQQDKAKVWCFVCNLIKRIEPNIGMIAYTFQRKDCYSHTKLYSNHRQICVSKQEIITDIQQEPTIIQKPEKDIFQNINITIEGGDDLC